MMAPCLLVNNALERRSSVARFEILFCEVDYENSGRNIAIIGTIPVALAAGLSFIRVLRKKKWSNDSVDNSRDGGSIGQRIDAILYEAKNTADSISRSVRDSDGARRIDDMLDTARMELETIGQKAREKAS